jgi:hypothetical protein
LSTEGLIASVVMLLVSLTWLAWPLLRRKFSPAADAVARQKEREILLTTYERTLAAIRDLDDDHLTGKLAQADYEAERAAWAEQGIAVLQALEKAGVKKPVKQPKVASPNQLPTTEAADAETELDDAIEQAIASYIKSSR